MLIDVGNDNNHDGHCDLDGWFVDKPYGCHKPVIRAGSPGKEYDARRSTLYRTSEVRDIITVDPSIKPEDLFPIYEYCRDHYLLECSSPRLNRALREEKLSPNQKDAVNQIDRLISRCALKKSMKLVRGISYKPGSYAHNTICKWLSDGIITDLAYASTTVSSDVASKYATKFEEQSCIITIWAPEGTHAFPLFLKNIEGPKGDEREILLPRSTKMEILKSSNYQVGNRIITSIVAKII